MKKSRKDKLQSINSKDIDMDAIMESNKARKKPTPFDPNSQKQITFGLVRQKGLYKIVSYSINAIGHAEQLTESDSMSLPVALAKLLLNVRNAIL